MPPDPRDYGMHLRGLGSDVTILSVGADKQKLAVHDVLLRTTSPFFIAALKEQWLGEERVIPLKDDEIHIVELYVQWLYHHKIYTRKPKDKPVSESDEYDILIEAFIFGEKIGDNNFKDTIIDAIIACSNTADSTGNAYNPVGDRVDRVYEGTPAGSPLRRLLLDNHMQRGSQGWVRQTQNVEFLRALVDALFNVRRTPGATAPLNGEGKSCVYHHHGDNPCYNTNLASKGQ